MSHPTPFTRARRATVRSVVLRYLAKRMTMAQIRRVLAERYSIELGQARLYYEMRLMAEAGLLVDRPGHRSGQSHRWILADEPTNLHSTK